MKTLIYMVSSGGPLFEEMTHTFLDSLREQGGYRGEIAVVTDGTFGARGKDVAVIPWQGAGDDFSIKVAKTACHPLLNAARYDRVMLTDVDIVARAPVQPLFDFSDSGVCGGREESITKLWNNPWMSACLTRPERLAAMLWGKLTGRPIWGISSGVLLFEGRRFDEWAQLWLDQIHRSRARLGPWIDQPPFNALVFRRRIPFRTFPSSWVHFPALYRQHGLAPAPMPQETILLHFAGLQRARALEAMQHWRQRRELLPGI